MIYQSHHWRAAHRCDCSSPRTELRRSAERTVYALSCGTVSLVEFTVNHIAFIARFSGLSSLGSIHFKLVPIRIFIPLYTKTWIHICDNGGNQVCEWSLCTSLSSSWLLLFCCKNRVLLLRPECLKSMCERHIRSKDLYY